MQGIYNYAPETNHVSRVYSVAAVLYLQIVPHVMLFRAPYMFYIFTLAIIIIIIIIIMLLWMTYLFYNLNVLQLFTKQRPHTQQCN